MKKEFIEKVLKVQNELKAPKGQYNSFGKYSYRNCEDILEAVKPLLLKYNLLMFGNDEIVLIGERYYVKATYTLTDGESQITAQGMARESFDKKGMDDSQITGATSSYARKYALNALYSIDDTKDADSHDNSQKPVKTDLKPVKSEEVKTTATQQFHNQVKDYPATEKQISYLKKLGFAGETKGLTGQKASAIIEEMKKEQGL